MQMKQTLGRWGEGPSGDNGAVPFYKASLGVRNEGTTINCGDLPPLSVPGVLGDYVDVIISFVESPDKFFMQLKNEEGRILALSEQLHKKYDKLSPSELELINPTRGQIVIARYKEDGNWYRALFLARTGPSTFKVYFVDYGNTEKIGRIDLKECTPDFLKQPPFAVLCKLNQVRPGANTQKFIDTVESHEATVRLEGVANQTFAVTMFMTIDKVDYNINMALQDRGEFPPAGRPPRPSHQTMNGYASNVGGGHGGSSFTDRTFRRSDDHGSAGGFGNRPRGDNRGSFSRRDDENRSNYGRSRDSEGDRGGFRGGGRGGGSRFGGGHCDESDRRSEGSDSGRGGFGSRGGGNDSRGSRGGFRGGRDGGGGGFRGGRDGGAGGGFRDGGESRGFNRRNDGEEGGGGFRGGRGGGRGGFSGGARGDDREGGGGFNRGGGGFGPRDDNGGRGGGGGFGRRDDRGGRGGGGGGFGRRDDRDGGGFERRNDRTNEGGGFGQRGGRGGFGGGRRNTDGGGFNTGDGGGGFGKKTSNEGGFDGREKSPVRAAVPPAPPAYKSPLKLGMGPPKSAFVSSGEDSSPSQFFLQFGSSEADIAAIGAKLMTLDTNAKKLTDAKENCVCAAKFDGLWFRAKVVKKVTDGGQSKYEVFYVDYGNSSTVEEVFELPKDALDAPPQAIGPCKIFGILPAPDSENAGSTSRSVEFSPEAVARFGALTEGPEFSTAELFDHKDGQFHVGLVVENTCDVAESLVSEGLAVWDFEEFSFPKQTPLDKQEHLNMFVGHSDVEAWDFYLQKETDNNEILGLSDKIESSSHIPVLHPALQMPCAAVFEGQWFRGVIQNIEEIKLPQEGGEELKESATKETPASNEMEETKDKEDAPETTENEDDKDKGQQQEAEKEELEEGKEAVSKASEANQEVEEQKLEEMKSEVKLETGDESAEASEKAEVPQSESELSSDKPSNVEITSNEPATSKTVVKVHYIDYGNCDETDLSNVCKIPAVLLKSPAPKAYNSRLGGIVAKPGPKFAQEAASLASTFLEGADVVQVNILGFNEEGKYQEVDIAHNGVFLSQELIREKFAKCPLPSYPPQRKIGRGTQGKASLVHCQSPAHLYVSLDVLEDRDAPLISAQLDSVEEKCSLSIEEMTPGVPCLYKDPKRNSFHRAQILGVVSTSDESETTKMSVLLVDFGRQEICPPELLFETTPALVTCAPPMAFLCSLAGVAPKGTDKEFSVDACAHLSAMMERLAHHDIQFVSNYAPEKPYQILVKFSDTEGTKKDLGEELIAADVARKREVIYAQPGIQFESLKVDDTYECRLAWADSPERFFMHLDKNSAQNDEIYEKIAAVIGAGYADKPENILKFPEEGSACLSQFQGEYFRGVIVSQSLTLDPADVRYTVHYVDYGNTESDIDKVLRVPDALLEYPRQAVLCSVSSCPDLPQEMESWPENITEKFRGVLPSSENFESKPCNMKLLSDMDDGGWIVALQDVEGIAEFDEFMRSILEQNEEEVEEEPVGEKADDGQVAQTSATEKEIEDSADAIATDSAKDEFELGEDPAALMTPCDTSAPVKIDDDSEIGVVVSDTTEASNIDAAPEDEKLGIAQ